MNNLRETYKPEEIKTEVKTGSDVEEFNIRLGTDTNKPGKYIPVTT